jgi:hypothetical protein
LAGVTFPSSHSQCLSIHLLSPCCCCFTMMWSSKRFTARIDVSGRIARWQPTSASQDPNKQAMVSPLDFATSYAGVHRSVSLVRKHFRRAAMTTVMLYVPLSSGRMNGSDYSNGISTSSIQALSETVLHVSAAAFDVRSPLLV